LYYCNRKRANRLLGSVSLILFWISSYDVARHASNEN
jgi:hypothetical protein